MAFRTPRRSVASYLYEDDGDRYTQEGSPCQDVWKGKSLSSREGSGIGRATALTFAREGAKLVVADMNEDGGQQTVHMITEQGGEATFVRTDVSQAVEVRVLISKAVETYGWLDCAHNNARFAHFEIAFQELEV